MPSQRRDEEGALGPDEEARDDGIWNLRTRDPEALHGFNVSVGRDGEGSVLRFLEPWPRRGGPAAEPEE